MNGRNLKQMRAVAKSFGVYIETYTPGQIRLYRFIWGPGAARHSYDGAPSSQSVTCKGRSEADTFLSGIQVAALNGIKYKGE